VSKSGEEPDRRWVARQVDVHTPASPGGGWQQQRQGRQRRGPPWAPLGRRWPWRRRRGCGSAPGIGCRLNGLGG